MLYSVELTDQALHRGIELFPFCECKVTTFFRFYQISGHLFLDVLAESGFMRHFIEGGVAGEKFVGHFGAPCYSDNRRGDFHDGDAH